MIQRQQTLWLILAAAASFLAFQFPFYTGYFTDDTIKIFKELDAGSNLFLLILTGASVLLAVVTIFLFKDRKMQLKFAVTGVLLSILIVVLFILEMRKFITGNLTLTSIFVFLIPVGYIMGLRGIRKDQKLIKSLDKLR